MIFDGLADDEISVPETDTKCKLGGAPVLPLPRLLGDDTVDRDAYNKQIGPSLLHEKPDGTVQPIEYQSRLFNAAEWA